MFDYFLSYEEYIRTCIRLKTALMINETQLGVTKIMNNTERLVLNIAPSVVLRKMQTEFIANGEKFFKLIDTDKFDDVGRVFTEGKVKFTLVYNVA